MPFKDPAPDPEQQALGPALVRLGGGRPQGLLKGQARSKERGEVARHERAFKGG